MTDRSNGPIRVLFLCTHNAARSQMAEAFLRHYGAGRFEVQRAGIEPSIAVQPLAEIVMRRYGIALGGQYPKHLDRFLGGHRDDVITICNDANEACPAFPDEPGRIHRGFPDPSKATGTEEERLRAFRRVGDEIRRRVQPFVALSAHRNPAGRGVGSAA